MNSSPIFFAAAIASVMASATASADSTVAYALTKEVAQSDPSRSNGISTIAMSDDYLLLGAPTNSLPGSTGQAFLFDVSGERLLHTFDDPQFHGDPSLGFGRGVAIDGNHLVVKDRFNLPGLVYVFDAASGLLRHSIESPIAGHLGFASGAVAVSGDYVAVGAEATSAGPFGPHYPARVFVFDAISGDLRHTLSPPPELNASSWGEFVDISDTTIAIGSPRVADTAVLLYDARTGDQVGSVRHPQVSGFDSLTIEGNRLLLGQIRGEAFLLDTAGNLLQTFESPGRNPEVSGALFDFSGNNILLGSFGSANANTAVEPEGWLFDATSGELLQRFTDGDPADRFFAMDSNPSGSQIAFVRARHPSFSTNVLIYSKVPEPSSAILAGLGASIAMLSFLSRTPALSLSGAGSI